MDRRVFLKAVSTSTVAGMTVLAGCSSGNDSGGSNGGDGDNGSSGSSGGTTASGESGRTATQASAGSPTPASNSSSASTTGTGDSSTTIGATTTGNSTTGTGATPAGNNSTTTGTATGVTTTENSTTAAGTGTTSSGGGTGGGTTTVKMYAEGSNYYFDPIGLFVKKGATVTWEIASSSHSSTAYKEGNGPAQVTRIPKGAKAWNSDIIGEGQTFEHTFETEGTYDYFCIPHKSLGMVGRIVVGSPGGPAEDGMPPDGNVPKSDTIVKQGSIAYSDFS